MISRSVQCYIGKEAKHACSIEGNDIFVDSIDIQAGEGLFRLLPSKYGSFEASEVFCFVGRKFVGFRKFEQEVLVCRPTLEKAEEAIKNYESVKEL